MHEAKLSLQSSDSTEIAVKISSCPWDSISEREKKANTQTVD